MENPSLENQVKKAKNSPEALWGFHQKGLVTEDSFGIRNRDWSKAGVGREGRTPEWLAVIKGGYIDLIW